MTRDIWNGVSRRNLSRRALLRASGLMGIGAVGLALVGCGDDDEAEAQPAAAEAPAAAAEAPAAAEGLNADALIAPKAAPETLLKALGTTEAGDPIVDSALARADLPISTADRALAFEAWNNGVVETGRGTLTVALADGFGENVWRRITNMEFILQALSYPQVKKIIYTTGQGDPTKAISDMQSLISQEVDIITTFPDGGEALLPTAIDATNRGILVAPYIAGLGGNAGTDYLTFVAEDLCELGRQFASIALEQKGNTINVVELGGTPGNLLSKSWQDCAEPVLSDAGANLLGKADTNWTQEGTFQAMSAFIAQGTPIDAILYEYSDGFRGGVRAFQATNAQMNFVLTLRTDEQGLIKDWTEARAANPNFKIFMSTGGTFQSRIALHSAILKLAGYNVPARVVVPFKLREVTAELYDPALPDDAPISSVVPADVLGEMFAV